MSLADREGAAVADVTDRVHNVCIELERRYVMCVIHAGSSVNQYEQLSIGQKDRIL
jgi:hypothetical protein